MNNGGEILFSVPVSVKNKKEMIDMFETLAHFPDTVMMLRNGDNTVDAHSLMGFFAIDEKIPIELLLESEPDDNLKQAISKFAFVLRRKRERTTIIEQVVNLSPDQRKNFAEVLQRSKLQAIL